jgi:prepilin-type N-terminal cleavage/methylation domain-containing protein
VRRLAGRRGYTLTEMMLVVAILGIISTIGPLLMNQLQNFYLMTTARNEIERDARNCLDTVNRHLRQAVDGTILIDNVGTMSTQAGQGIDLNNIVSASTHSTINNFGLISAAADDGIRPGTNATINNHGQIVGMQGGDGIDGQQGTNIAIHNFAGGSITGARHGVTGDFPIAVINDAGASILGQQGSGLNMDTAADSIMTVVNHGNITGTATGSNDGDGIDVDGLISLDNYGTIRAVGHSADVINEALALGGGIVNNYAGGIIHSDDRAITVDNSDLGNAFGPSTIYNEGTIQGDDGEAISITDLFGDTITNKGAIIGSIATGGGDDVFNLHTGSSIVGAVDGGDVGSIRSTCLAPAPARWRTFSTSKPSISSAAIGHLAAKASIR